MEINPVVTSVDLVTFEILSHRLYQIAREMGTALERVGGTVNTTQMHDYMASLYLANGDVLSVGDSGGGTSHVRGLRSRGSSSASKKMRALIPTIFFCSTILISRRFTSRMCT